MKLKNNERLVVGHVDYESMLAHKVHSMIKLEILLLMQYKLDSLSFSNMYMTPRLL